MLRSIKYLVPAKQELKEAIRYYNSQSPGLGFEFSYEIQKSLDKIINYPESWPILSTTIRKCVCNRFPFNLLYIYNEPEIIIVAVMHQKREPNYWANRLN